MDISNERKTNYALGIVIAVFVIILLLFQFVNFAPKTSPGTDHNMIDSLNHKD